MRENHETDILKICCRICGKTAPKSQSKNIRPDECRWFNIKYDSTYKICIECRGLYTTNKDADFPTGN